MALSDTIKKLITNAWDDGYPCMLATVGKDGPNISPKGSMIVYDDQHLAYWERSKKKALENLGQDRRVMVMYSNFKAQRDKVGVRFPAVLGHRRAVRVRTGARCDLRQAPQARAGARRRRYRHRRSDQDQPRRRRAWPAHHVTLRRSRSGEYS